MAETPVFALGHSLGLGGTNCDGLISTNFDDFGAGNDCIDIGDSVGLGGGGNNQADSVTALAASVLEAVSS
jgi:hypothetical protein